MEGTYILTLSSIYIITKYWITTSATFIFPTIIFNVEDAERELLIIYRITVYLYMENSDPLIGYTFFIQDITKQGQTERYLLTIYLDLPFGFPFDYKINAP